MSVIATPVENIMDITSYYDHERGDSDKEMVFKWTPDLIKVELFWTLSHLLILKIVANGSSQSSKCLY